MALRLEVRCSLYGIGPDQTRLAIDESVEIPDMSFGQLSQLLEAFHTIAEAVKAGRNLNVGNTAYQWYRATETIRPGSDHL